ncbi:MAG: tetratricopeptide repeat protein [Muribaculaceae bacterium]|nr:tetratricopeptide repeat protein [Muribaculaceae bacterium]
MHARFIRIAGLVAAAIIVAAMVACTPNKNNAATRNYQAFITRYNVYYNGDKHYKETLADMEGKYEDDFSRRLYMHPVEAKDDPSAPQPSGDFTRSIEKAQKAIQIRSIKKKPKVKGSRNSAKNKEWLRREEYNPFLHNAWMMMGRSQYYNGDFLGAASTFFYVSKHFKWLPATVTEARLLQALSYVSMGWQYEAEVILTRITQDELVNNRLRKLYNFVYADFYLHADNYADAIPFLEASVKGARGAQKTRLNFLLGQVYQLVNRPTEAYKAFSAAGSSSSAPYRTKFNARIKQSEVYQGSDIESEVKALRRMTRYDRNKEYLDQIYYAIGNLYLSHGDTVKAMENYELANEKSTRNGIDKAINQVRLGELYFLRGNYEKAQPNYSEAVPQLPETYPGYADIKRRSDVLDELAVYSQNVNLQDSLLRLADMSEEQRNKVIEKIIEELKEKEKKEAEEARREEYLANEAAQGNKLQDNSTQSFVINSDNSWYFYNTATRNAGKTEFQKRWGSRKLEDNWRRRNKASFNTDDFASGEEEGTEDVPTGDEGGEEQTEPVDTAAAARAADPHFPEYYLAQIPMTEADRMTSNDVIQEGLYNMGVILKDKLEDFTASKREFDRLLADYPDNVYRLDAYYNLYLMAVRRGLTAEAERWRQLIISDFADSKYGVAMKDPHYFDNLRDMDRLQENLYAETYEAYLDNRNADVHAANKRMQKEYPLSKIMPKFMFLDALAYVTEKDAESFKSTLRELLDRYPDTDLTPIASAWLKGVAQGRELQAGSDGNIRGMIWDLRLTNDTTATEAEGMAQFELNPDVGQTLVFTFPTDKVSSNALLYDIARHNFKSFVVKDFDIEQMNFGRLGMIIVRGFANQAELDHYRSVMASSGEFRLPAGVRPIAISEDNLRLLFEQGRSFEEYFRYLEEQNYIDAQADLLAPEEIETLEEAEEKSDEPPVAPESPDETESPDDIEIPADSAASAEPVVPDTVSVVPDSVPAMPDSVPAMPAPKPKPTPAKPVPKPQPTPTKPVPAPLLPGSEGDDDPLLME